MVSMIPLPQRASPSTLAPMRNRLKRARIGLGLRIPPIWEGKQSLRPTLSDLAPPETDGFRAEARTHFENGGAA